MGNRCACGARSSVKPDDHPRFTFNSHLPPTAFHDTSSSEVPTQSPAAVTNPQYAMEAEEHFDAPLSLQQSPTSIGLSPPHFPGFPLLGVYSNGIIPGLPDDLAIQCLCRVSIVDYPSCRGVNRSWKTVFEGEEVHHLRRLYGMEERLLIATRRTISMTGFGTAGGYYLMDQKDWSRMPELPPEPSKSDQHLQYTCYYQMATWRHYLFVVGGCCEDYPSPRVFKYNCVKNQWLRMADMATPRHSFACEVVGNLLFVAGGYGFSYKALSSVEVYDIENNTWTQIQPLHFPRAKGLGIAVDNKFLVVGGWVPTPSSSAFYTDEVAPCNEEYDPAINTWSLIFPFDALSPTQEEVWNSIAYMDDFIFIANDNEVWYYNRKTRVWGLEDRIKIPEGTSIQFIFGLEENLILLTNIASAEHTEVHCWSIVENKFIGCTESESLKNSNLMAFVRSSSSYFSFPRWFCMPI